MRKQEESEKGNTYQKIGNIAWTKGNTNLKI